MKKRIVDLFAGCGGLTQGFQDAGFEVVGAFEFWNVAADCYEVNFKHPVFRSDLSDVKNAIEEIRTLNPEIIIGGPPCQDFSHAGKRVEDERADLTVAYANIVAKLAPRWFVMENVDRAQKSTKYQEARAILKAAGYGLTEIVLNAALCGAPQRRKRFFCIGSMDVEDGFLTEYIKKAQSKKEMTLHDYFGDSLGIEHYYRHPRNYSRRAIYSINEPSATVRGVNRPVPQGYPGHAGDSCVINDEVRPLTTLERALVQTFPPKFKWLGSKTDMEQMIGNAVPVKLAEFVAKALIHHIQTDESSDSMQNVNFDDFREWLHENKNLSDKARGDVVSRLKRAAKIYPIPNEPDAHYIFTLEQAEEFKKLSVSVRSQMKRAVSLYADYIKACVA